jgi:uncharacterized protein with HEPN domain
MRSQRQYIRDILEAMEAAESFVEDVRFENLEGDLEKQCRVTGELKQPVGETGRRATIRDEAG